MNNLGRFGVASAILLALATFQQATHVVKAAGGPVEAANGTFRVLAPIESGNLLLFPVIWVAGNSPGETPFITLDEGIGSGEVEVTEAGRAQGLVRPRRPVSDGSHTPRFLPEPDRRFPDNSARGDEVNTLVLVNRSSKPLLLLAGEIVTGGKQDRVIAKDRIVPVGADPIDLSVFCIEPGRWTESSPDFGAAAKALAHGFMVQPTVRERAMVQKDQQQVWDSVQGAISQMEMAAAPPAFGSINHGVLYAGASPNPTPTTSYARVMQNDAVSQKIDQAASPIIKSRDLVLARLREEHAVGVIVAVRGEIVWADIFVDPELLSRYWIKLVRSYAAESLTRGQTNAAPTMADAQHFLDAPTEGTEFSEGDVGVYRYRELNNGKTETFILQSLLPRTGYDVHICKMKLITPEYRSMPQMTDAPERFR